MTIWSTSKRKACFKSHGFHISTNNFQTYNLHIVKCTALMVTGRRVLTCVPCICPLLKTEHFLTSGSSFMPLPDQSSPVLHSIPEMQSLIWLFSSQISFVCSRRPYKWNRRASTPFLGALHFLQSTHGAVQQFVPPFLFTATYFFVSCSNLLTFTIFIIILITE